MAVRSRGIGQGAIASAGLSVRELISEEARSRRGQVEAQRRGIREYAQLVPEGNMGPLRLDEFPYQLEPFYSDEVADAIEVVYRKSTQIGASTALWRWAVRRCDQFGETTMYFFPTATHVTEFGDERIEPSIEASEYLRRRIPRGHTRRKTMKQIGGGILNLRGLESKAGAQAVAAQAIVIDEYDDCNEKNISQAERRLTGAAAKGHKPRIRRSGRPSLPGYGIDAQYCIAPETPILMADLSWRPAGELIRGDELLAFDEESKGARGRCFRRTKVKGAPNVVLPSRRIVLEDGTQVVSTTEHRWLVLSATNLRWKKAASLREGDVLCSLSHWEKDESRSAGWLAGIFDGEGWVSHSATKNGNPTGLRVGISQNDGGVLQAVKAELQRQGFAFAEDRRDRCVRLTLKGDLPECLRFLGTIRPERLVKKAEEVWPGLNVGCARKIKIARIEDLGERLAIALATEHKTIVAHGLLSHNSESDQRQWHVRCPKCGDEQLVEFAENLRWRSHSGGKAVLRAGRDDFEVRKDVTEAWRACRSCDASLEGSPVKDGVWKATAHGPGRVPGYHIPRLIVPNTDLVQIVVASRATRISDVEAFHNADLGVPYAAADAMLTDEDLDRAMAHGYEEAHLAYDGRFPTTMGVDVASERNLSARITEHWPDGTRKALRVWEPADFEEVARAMDAFNITLAAIDAQPERRSAKGLVRDFPGRVVLVEYESNPRKKAWHYDSDTFTVRVNRTEAIDAMMDDVRSGANVLLRDEPTNYREQMKALKRRIEEDAKGEPRKLYVTTGQVGDDYAHAEVYDLVAKEMLIQLQTAAGMEGEPQQITPEQGPVRLGWGVTEYDPGFGEGGEY